MRFFRLNGLFIATPALVLDMFQILPLALYLLVGLHFDIRLASLKAKLLIAGDEVVEQQGIGTLLLVFRQETHQHQV